MPSQRRAYTYASDQAWARRYEAATVTVLAPHLSLLVGRSFTAQHAGLAEDVACIGDLRISVGAIHVLSRVRDASYHQRDLTLRSWRSGEIETEVKKILSGAGKWYFYGWAEHGSLTFDEWMLVDLDIVRRRGTIEHNHHRETWNTDETTAFIAIPRISLEYDGAIRIQQRRQAGEVRLLFDTGERWTAEECDAWLAEHQKGIRRAA